MKHFTPHFVALFFFFLTAPVGAEEIVLNFVGDIMLASSATPLLARTGYDHPFTGTAHELTRGDITIGNLEAPISRGGNEFTAKKFRFRTSPQAAPALKRAGFSVLTLANNHMMDFGAVALHDTVSHLKQAGIVSTGAGKTLTEARRPAVIGVKGKSIAFLAYSLTQPIEFFAGPKRAGTAPGYRPYVEEDVRKAKSAADYVVVSFHWGAERAELPKQYQRDAAYCAIDAGADLVIGHHPHVLQGIESYRGRPILYSLGNFAFGSRSPHADRSMIARVRLNGRESDVEIIPLNVLYADVRYRPVVLEGKRGEAVIAHLNRISRQLGTVIAAEGGRYRLVSPDLKRQMAAR